VKILLTGATGFVGFNLLLRLLNEPGVRRIVLPLRAPGRLRAKLALEKIYEIPPQVEILTAEAPEWNLESSKLTGLTHAVHAAAMLFGDRLEDYRRVNVEGTLRLLQQLPDGVRPVLLSSQSAGGPTPGGMPARDEETPDSPISHYGISKGEMEQAVMGVRPCTLLRPPMVLGPRDTATLPLFKLAGSPLRIKPGFHEKTFSWIGVDDLVSAILATLHPGNTDLPSSPLYVASEGWITDRQLIERAGLCLKKHGVIVPLPLGIISLAGFLAGVLPPLRRAVPSLAPDRAREILPDRWTVSDQKFRSAVDWEPTSRIDHVLGETCRYYLQAGLI